MVMPPAYSFERAEGTGHESPPPSRCARSEHRAGHGKGPVDVDGGGNNDRAVRDASESLIDCSTIVAVFFPEICKTAGQRAAPQEICSSPTVTEA
jgi:hypothetical protein